LFTENAKAIRQLATDIGLVTFRLRFESHRGSFASKREKLLTYRVLRTTQPPVLDGMGNE